MLLSTDVLFGYLWEEYTPASITAMYAIQYDAVIPFMIVQECVQRSINIRSKLGLSVREIYQSVYAGLVRLNKEHKVAIPDWTMLKDILELGAETELDFVDCALLATGSDVATSNEQVNKILGISVPEEQVELLSSVITIPEVTRDEIRIAVRTAIQTGRGYDSCRGQVLHGIFVVHDKE